MPRYTSGSTWPSDSSYLGNTDLPVQEYGKQLSMEASMWVRNSTVGSTLKASPLTRLKSTHGCTSLICLRKWGAARTVFLSSAGNLLVSQQQQRQVVPFHGSSTSFSHITVLALRCCGTCLRRQLVIKLEREGLWVLAFGSCPQWLTFYHSFSLWQGALHLLAVTVLGATAEALTRIGHQQGSSTGSPPGKLIQIKQRCKADLPAVIKHSS